MVTCYQQGHCENGHRGLRSVDEVLQQGQGSIEYEGDTIAPRIFRLTGLSIRRLDESEERRLDLLSGLTVHAVAGIGHPERFFSLLEAAKISVIPHPLADHAMIDRSDLDFGDDLPVVMTEKDAVKCQSFHLADAWYVPADVVMDDGDKESVSSNLINTIGKRHSI